MPTIYTWPATLIPNAIEWSLQANTQVFESPLSRTLQTVSLTGDRWAAVLTFTNLPADQALELTAFLSRLRGRAGRFRIPPFHHSSPAGTALGTPLVKGAGQVAGSSTLTTDGWTAGQAGALLPGDFFQVGNELKMVVTAAASDGSGNATLTVVPPLRTSPADNAAIVTASPTCVMMLAEDTTARWMVQPGTFYALSIPCIEAIDP